MALGARLAGLTVTVKLPGTVPEAGLTESQPPVLAAVAENVAPVAPLTLRFCVEVVPPACKLKFSVDGVTVTDAPAVTVRLTETVVGVPPLVGVKVTAPV